MMKERLLQRVDELIDMGNAVLRTRHRDSDSGGENELTACFEPRPRRQVSGPEWVDDGKMKEFRTASLSFMQRVYSEKHPHFQEFFKTADRGDPRAVECGLGILRAIRGEIAGDWLFTVRSLVTAEVFTDYMDMAEYLLELNYKDPAAVVAGSTLEEHLRQLCRKNGIPITQQKSGKAVPLTGEPLNIDLAKAGVYNSVEQKLITGWLGIRNSAAHGKYEEYSADQVRGMITGIPEFMARVPV
jgi:hypothetical protein